ncbi:MAG: hypothetical protein A2Y25_00845 [Candidatus Melainabacteria bacterium GWF2_37_15]|nr:MAG: hypothetical protein A2Y25_00845 [Candidatus Melainabacteria bacterium GWF2_37_15]
MLKIQKAKTLEQLEQARKLFIEYSEFLDIDLCFQNFENEINNLSSVYSEPDGGIFLASFNLEVVGCIALKKLEGHVGEIKRLYVKDEYRNMGIGRKLFDKILDFAKEKGYQKVRLDTLNFLESAIKLYKAYGFREIPAYNSTPRDDVLYFELSFFS